MVEKAPATLLPRAPRSQTRLRWRYYLLMILILPGMFVSWRINRSNVTDFIRVWTSERKFLSPVTDSTQNKQSPGMKSSSGENFIGSVPLMSAGMRTIRNSEWISADFERNFTFNLLRRWSAPGGRPCLDSHTVQISIPGMDGRKSIALPTGEIHEFVFHTQDEAGSPRCSGGDYFETDIYGKRWRARPPVRDQGNGSYSFFLQVHPDFSGDYNFTVILLFRKFEGLKFSPQRFSFDRELRKIAVKFYRSQHVLPDLKLCAKSDFNGDVWSGRWTRLAENDTCDISNDGRYRCLSSDLRCRKPWCDGSLAVLESNGWVYSAHCSFQIFTSDAAWNCLNDRWIFFWGDSNHVDTIRNTLNFILVLRDIQSVPRRFDKNFTNPRNSSQSVRITSIFNGHPNETKNYEGLHSLQNPHFRALLEGYFAGDTVPDTMIMNSGLHDGVYWRNMKRFVDGAEYASAFWSAVLESVKRRGMRVPELIYRTTIATGGHARSLAFNPSKMEAFNGIVLEKFRAAGFISGVVDNFDMTYAWHFDNRCNDGVHYGRAPLKMRWRDGELGHQYFVDIMLAHVLLNSICTS